MENVDNNIVVNAKPNTIVLQSSEEEVTGGYYDGEGEWHELGTPTDLGPYAGRRFRHTARTLDAGGSSGSGIALFIPFKVVQSTSNPIEYCGFLSYSLYNRTVQMFGVSPEKTVKGSIKINEADSGDISTYGQNLEIEVLMDYLDEQGRIYFDSVFEEITE